MLATVRLNDQSTLVADEFRDEWTDGLLPAEFGTIQMAVSKN